jgi:hypothetical protein
MIDAYMVSDRFPYVEKFLLLCKSINYIRNSVKIVDAYHGDVNFYVSDADDPMIQVYSKIFPNVFQPMSELPESLVSHVRYLVDFFDV